MPYNNNVRRNRSTNKKKIIVYKTFPTDFCHVMPYYCKHLTVNELKLSMPGISKYIKRRSNADIQKI